MVFQVTWDSRDYYDDKEARRRYEVRFGKLQEEWEPVEKALDGDAAVPMALLDPLLDAIQGQLDARAADVEREMAAKGPAAHEVIAGCHRQALDFTELRATYSRQLAGRLVNARESIEQVGKVSNLYYRSLLSAPIKRILEGCSSNSEVQE